MKKIALTLLLAGGSIAVFAQETDTTKKPKTIIDSTQGWRADTMMNRDMNRTNINDTMSSSGDYNAYRALNIPTTVTRNFQASYPNVSDARWSKSYNGDWRVVYRYNGQNMNMYYSNRGESYMVALPVLQNMVPEEVVNKALELYGMNIYDVTRLKSVDSTMDVYQVRTLANGQLRTDVISADGSAAPAGWNDLSKLEGGMQRNVLPDSANMNMQRNNMAPDSARMMQNMRDTSNMQMRDTNTMKMPDTLMQNKMKDSSMMKMMKDSSMNMDDSMKMKMDDSTMMKHHMRDTSMMKDSSMMNMNSSMNNNATDSSATNVTGTENTNANMEMKAGESTDVKIKSKTADGKSKMKNKNGKIKTKDDQ